MLDQYFVDTCHLITPGRNEYGDYVQGSTVEVACRFRPIATLRRETHRTVADADAMLWVSSSSGVVNESIVLFESVYYQVERITSAKRLGETEVQFIKCDLKIIDMALS